MVWDYLVPLLVVALVLLAFILLSRAGVRT
jgi:hypothetical protein